MKTLSALSIIASLLASHPSLAKGSSHASPRSHSLASGHHSNHLGSAQSHGASLFGSASSSHQSAGMLHLIGRKSKA